MTFWIQHGYGKAAKIDTTAKSGLLTGVVLSPADEEQATLDATVAAVKALGAEPLIDPQLYVHTITGAVARGHESHGLDFGELSWFVSPAEIEAQVGAVIAANQRLGIDRIIAPSPYQASFGDVWTPLSLQYARATIESADRPVYISLVAEDAAFSDWEQTVRYMDALTTLDATGVYVIVGTSGKTYPLSWEPERLANVLRVVYTLGELNQYEVLWGYSDLAGVLGVLAGASGAATGWYNSLRLWTTGKWVPQSGGRQANPRIFVEPLLSAVERDGEGISIARTSLGAAVFPDLDERRNLVNEEPWGIADSWGQHMAAIAEVHQTVDPTRTVAGRVADFRQSLVNAVQLHRELTDAGAAVAPAHSTRLMALIESLDIFAAAEGL